MEIKELILIILAICGVIILFSLIVVSSRELDYIKECSFYIPNATCEEMVNVCNTEATFILRDANKGLGIEIDECRLDLEKSQKNRIDKLVLLISILLNIFLLILRTKDNIKKRKSVKNL